MRPSRSRSSGDTPAAPLRALDRFVLYATVMLTGGAVMVLELLGTRIIGPFYGVSLYVWSSLIAVTLIALALGYYAGGWCADHAPRVRLAHLLTGAALTTLLIPLASGPVLMATDSLGMRAGAFVSALALFMLPLTCLGMAGPYVIKLATRDLAGVGSTAGSVYAVSTAGSVFGTLALGFYLLPVVGTRRILDGTGILLLLLGIALAWHERRRAGGGRTLAVLSIAIAAAASLLLVVPVPARTAEGFVVRHEAESTYGWVRVVDDERNGFRLLLSDASSLSAVRMPGGQTVLEYQQLLYVLPLFRPQPQPAERRALLIGLGGGHVATYMKSRGIATDTIEIDPAVAQAAVDYFGFRPTGRFVVGDARYEVRKLPARYDFIIHDCFTGGAEPIHLLSVEMLRELRDKLADGGLLALNFVGFSRGPGSEAVASVSRTLAEVFPNQRVFVTAPGGEFTDFVFLASARSIEFSPQDDFEHLVLKGVLQFEQAPPRANGIVISDDFNPLEHMQVRKAELYREALPAAGGTGAPVALSRPGGRAALFQLGLGDRCDFPVAQRHAPAEHAGRPDLRCVEEDPGAVLDARRRRFAEDADDLEFAHAFAHALPVLRGEPGRRLLRRRRGPRPQRQGAGARELPLQVVHLAREILHLALEIAHVLLELGHPEIVGARRRPGDGEQQREATCVTHNPYSSPIIRGCRVDPLHAGFARCGAGRPSSRSSSPPHSPPRSRSRSTGATRSSASPRSCSSP